MRGTNGSPAYVQTGQVTCHDASGHEITCTGSGQDGEFRRGVQWPTPRFVIEGGTARDQLTGLAWCRNANLAEYPLTWREAFDYVMQMNHERVFGYSDWRIPNRRELRSLISHQARQPALPEAHPFTNLFQGWYWTSTTAAISPAHAWYVNLEGGRMFYGGKDQSFLVWPVRGQGNGNLPVTGQTQCYGELGERVHCAGTGQDGEFLCGRSWPLPRFGVSGQVVIDQLTNLCWRYETDLVGEVAWEQALAAVARLNEQPGVINGWRLPNINELESLIDSSTHDPALPVAHPFVVVQDGYWSSTTSLYEPDWAWVLYLNKGAIGVGQKTQACFHVWAVRG